MPLLNIQFNSPSGNIGPRINMWSRRSFATGYVNMCTRLSSSPWATPTTLELLWAFPWLVKSLEAAPTSKLYSSAVREPASSTTAATRSTTAARRGGCAQTWLTSEPTTLKTPRTVSGWRRRMSEAGPRWWGWWQWRGKGEGRKASASMSATVDPREEGRSSPKTLVTGVTARCPTWLWCFHGGAKTWVHSSWGRPLISAKSEDMPASFWTSASHRRKPFPWTTNVVLFKLHPTATYTLIACSPNWPESMWCEWRSSFDEL